MSFSPEQLQRHCEIILSYRRIRNKIVVLCEGKGGIWELQGKPSPQSYRRMAQMPDANFYNACVPKWWRNYRPEFFNCGDRTDVLDTYFTLLQLHDKDRDNSYLSPEKLFAIVDLDLQLKTIDNYPFPDTEAIFQDLYEQAKVNPQNAINHRIWVTGFIYKESYFLFPELQPVFDNFSATPIYKDNPALLQTIYIDMADGISNDANLRDNLQRASKRLRYCSGLDCQGVNELRDSWRNQFKNAPDEQRKQELIFALLTIKKAKEYWNQFNPPTDWSRPIEVYRDQLSLEIGRFYAEKSSDVHYHLPFFWKTLYEKDCQQRG
jgi:hypothetical protein